LTESADGDDMFWLARSLATGRTGRRPVAEAADIEEIAQRVLTRVVAV
jgi:hypothetical protein